MRFVGCKIIKDNRGNFFMVIKDTNTQTIYGVNFEETIKKDDCPLYICDVLEEEIKKLYELENLSDWEEEIRETLICFIIGSILLRRRINKQGLEEIPFSNSIL